MTFSSPLQPRPFYDSVISLGRQDDACAVTLDPQMKAVIQGQKIRAASMT